MEHASTFLDGFTSVGTLNGSQYSFTKADVPYVAGLYVFRFPDGRIFNLGEGGKGNSSLQTLFRYGKWLERIYPAGDKPHLVKKYDNERKKQREWREMVDGQQLEVLIQPFAGSTEERRAEEDRLTVEHRPIWNCHRQRR